MTAVPHRLPASFQPNQLTLAVAQARGEGRALLDLTLTNPTRAGFHYPADLLQALASPEGLEYRPEPRGRRDAREAVTGDYLRRGLTIDPDRIVLTASTSEAYGWLFKLLCLPLGEQVLVPTPSYPLFEHLTRLEGITAAPYRLEYHGRWTIDLDTIDAAWSDSVRAVLVVSPNNPTGSELDPAEMSALGERCAHYGVPIILDEVFADYPLGPAGVRDSLLLPADCLTFRLGGLSKSAGLPQVKLGWIALDGPDHLVARALEQLELIADTYLSVSTPVQVAASSLIAAGAAVRSQILDRVRVNYHTLIAAAARCPAIDALPADAGWSAVLRVPAIRSEEELALALLEEDGVLVHPGYFFDFAHEAFVVVSLLPAPEAFAEGIKRLLERADG